jgi:hypothetical protein
LAKRAIELGAFDIEFKAWPAIKGQVIADFLAETPAGTEINIPAQELEADEQQECKLYIDRVSCGGDSGIGLLFENPKG